MHFKKIKKHIDIEASSEKVWEVLVTPASYEIWAVGFSKRSLVKTDWQEGSSVVFTDSMNSGLFGIIERNINSEFLSITYKGVVENGVQDELGEKAQRVKNARDSYSLSSKDAGTRLKIESDVEEKYFNIKTKSWDKALNIIKDLSEIK